MKDLDSNSYINISGSIGISVLINHKLNKKLYIFYDDHSNKKYCNKNYNMFLDGLFNLLKNKYIPGSILFLLEEPLINTDSKILNIFDDSIHVVKSKKFYLKLVDKCAKNKICDAFPIDIRLCLFDISLDELIENINDLNYFSDIKYDCLTYFKNLLYIFDIVQDNEYNIYENKINENISNIEFIKKILNIFSDSEYYNRIKKYVKILYQNFIIPYKNKKLNVFLKNNLNYNYSFVEGFPFISDSVYITSQNINLLDLVDKILNSLLEFYTIILINYLKKDTIIINTGLFHGINIKYILKNVYHYKIIYESGLTNYNDIDKEDKKSNCLCIEKNIFNIF